MHFLSSANLKVLTDTALPKYLNESVLSLQEKDPSSIVDIEEVFHELTTQLMGRMAYNVSPELLNFTSSPDERRWTFTIRTRSRGPLTSHLVPLESGSKIPCGKSLRSSLVANFENRFRK